MIAALKIFFIINYNNYFFKFIAIFSVYKYSYTTDKIMINDSFIFLFINTYFFVILYLLPKNRECDYKCDRNEKLVSMMKCKILNDSEWYIINENQK